MSNKEVQRCEDTSSNRESKQVGELINSTDDENGVSTLA